MISFLDKIGMRLVYLNKNELIVKSYIRKRVDIMREIVIKKCMRCGATVEMLKNGMVVCCGEPMVEMKPNTADAAAEKHLPEYEVVGDEVIVTVNHVMDPDHYIEWIGIACDEKVGKKFLKPGDPAKHSFSYVPGSKLYAYCNKHGLWMVDVK